MTAYKLLTTMILFGCGYIVKAQDLNKAGEKFRKLLESTSVPHKLKKTDTSGISNLLTSKEFIKQGRFSHSTSRGDVYLMPYDNMPCLVPDMKKLSAMPGAQNSIDPRNKMPNATPPYTIPKKENKKFE